MSAKKGPLDGVRVLDLTEFIFGPYATQILGDLGADVIKIEAPGGDKQRFGLKQSKSKNMGSTFMTLNRNKKSVTLDLKVEADREKLRALIPTAQVFIHNVRADAIARLGFSYDDVAKLNPSIVYVHCVGYGSDGPYAGRQAFDDLVQAAERRRRSASARRWQRGHAAAAVVCRRQGVQHARAVRDARGALSPESAPAKASSSKCRCSNASHIS